MVLQLLEHSRGYLKIYSDLLGRQIQWSGYTWNVKSGFGGPGPNKWSDGTDHVYVDNEGNLHLKIIEKDGIWYCAEIFGNETLGYGTYVFELKEAKLADNAVLGMFVYQDDEREIDIEMSKWGVPEGPNMSFVVQQIIATKDTTKPYHHEFDIDPNITSINKFFYSESEVNFQSESKAKVESWKYPLSYIPKTENEKVDLNLWLHKGEQPSNEQQQEVIIKNFKFIKNNSIE